MKCKDCQHRKPMDAIEVMDGAPDWVCTQKHSECEDMVCLMRMMIWSLNYIEELLQAED